jgi:branched-chain amino acid transport system permease protein
MPLLAIGLGAVVLALLPLVSRNTYLLTLLFLVFTAAALAESWVVLGGFAGYVSFGHATFFGLGLYGAGILWVDLGWSPLVSVLPVTLTIGVFAGVLGLGILHLQGPYFALLTLMSTLVLRLLISNSSLTGAQGLWVPQLPWSAVTNALVLYEAMLGVLVIITLSTYLIQVSRIGLGLTMLRCDEWAAETSGVPTRHLKVLAFVCGAVGAGLVGTVFVAFRSYTQPDLAFDIFLSITTVLIALVGGRTVWYGPLPGAILVVGLQELVTITIGEEPARILFGVLLVLVMLVVPDGMVGIWQAVQRGRAARSARRNAYAQR